MDKYEMVVFCAYADSDTKTCIVARNVSTGVICMTYRGDACRQLVVVESSYLVAVDEVRPKIIVWVINKKDPLHTIACPSRPRCISSSESYLVAGIENSIYLWMICTGSLLRTVDHHLQSVTSLQMQSNHFFVSGDEEGWVAVWSVQGLLQQRLDHQPLCSSNHHSSCISHLAICKDNWNEFTVVSASLDRSVRVWQGRQMRQLLVQEHSHAASCVLLHHHLLVVALQDASLLVFSLSDTNTPPTTIHYKSPITSMVMLGGEELLVGMLNGEVAVSMLKQPPHKIFKHPGRVTCMVVEDGLEEGWNEGDWKPTLPFIVLSTRPGVEGKEMVMQLRGSYEDRASGACKESFKRVSTTAHSCGPPSKLHRALATKFVHSLSNNKNP